MTTPATALTLHCSRWLGLVLSLAAAASLSASATAQLSLTSAVNLALSASPRVKMAQDEVDRARAGLSEAKDVYIPVLSAGGGLGYPLGFSAGVPSIFNVTANSLVFNFSQRDYIRSARANLDAASLSLRDARETIVSDTVLTYLAVSHDVDRERTRSEQTALSQRLVHIVEDRLAAGRDTAIDLTTARLSLAQLRLSMLHDADQASIDRSHLARLTGMPSINSVAFLPAFPAAPAEESVSSTPTASLMPAVQAAYANAHAKQEQARGDAKYVLRPQIALGIQYQQFASYQNQAIYYPAGLYRPYLADLGVQFTIPIFDRGHKAKERGSAAAASSAFHEADYARDQAIDAQTKLRNSLPELRARAEVAMLEEQLAHQQLDVLLVQLNSSTSQAGTQFTPKDEVNSRIGEREKHLASLDADFQLHEAEINLLRTSGQLENWLTTAASTAPTLKR